MFRSIHHKALQGFFALYLNTLAQHRRFVHQLKEPLADHIETFHHLNFKTFCVLQAEEGLLSQISHHPWATALKTVTLNLGEALGIQQAFPYAKDPLKTPAYIGFSHNNSTFFNPDWRATVNQQQSR